MSEMNADLVRKNKSLERVLKNIVECLIDNYKEMNQHSLPKQPEKTDLEGFLRNVYIQKYVRQNKRKYGLGHVLFLVETGEIDKKYHNSGYLDIQVLNINIEDVGNEDEYFTFECKRLENNAKNQAYIDNGILRFVQNKYAKKMPFSGMIGFVEKAQKGIPLIASDLKLRINKLPTTIKEFDSISQETGFEFSYRSKHNRIENTPIELTHLLFDFEKILNSSSND